MTTKYHALSVAASKIASNASSLNVTATMDSPKSTKFTASFAYTEDNASHVAVICSDNGKVKVYGDIDSMLKAIAKAAPQLETIVPSVAIGAFTPDVLIYDQEAYDAKLLVRRQAQVTAQTAVVSALTSKLSAVSSWNGGTAVQQAAYDKIAREKATALEYKNWLDSEVTRLTP